MPTDALNDVQKDLESYLETQVADGQQYFKSKYIAEALDLTPKSVGTNLGLLQEKTECVVIESWSGGSSGTTWRVTSPDAEADEVARADDSPSRSLAVVTDD